jgi:hypothetical protein
MASEAASPIAARERHERHRVSVDEYVTFREHGFLAMRGLVPRADVDELNAHMVAHYCNARSYVPWNHGMPYQGESGNYLHILARGSTHLPYAQPEFGTPCAANRPRPAEGSAAPAGMMGGDDGMMDMEEFGDSDRGE